MHASLRLRSRHTLHTMHARLVLQRAVHIVTAHGEVYLLESAHGTLTGTRHGQTPTLLVTELLVHIEQVAREEGRLVAAGAGPYLHLHVLAVLRILGYERDFYLLLYLRLQGFVLSQLLTRHLPHVGIALVGHDVLGLLYGVEATDVAFACVHDVAEVLVLLGELHEPLLVGYHLRVGDERRHFLEPALKPLEFLQNIVVLRHNC